jgi:hypothetical protein
MIIQMTISILELRIGRSRTMVTTLRACRAPSVSYGAIIATVALLPQVHVADHNR